MSILDIKHLVSVSTPVAFGLISACCIYFEIYLQKRTKKDTILLWINAPLKGFGFSKKPTKYRFECEVGDMMKNKHIGSSFDDFLKEEGILGEAQAIAVARVLAWEVSQYLAEHNTTKTAFAKVLETSRMQVDRLIDPEDTSVSLNTMAKVAEAMGKKLEFRLV